MCYKIFVIKFIEKSSWKLGGVQRFCDGIKAWQIGRSKYDKYVTITKPKWIQSGSHEFCKTDIRVFSL